MWPRKRRRVSPETDEARRRAVQAVEELEAAKADDQQVDAMNEEIERIMRRNNFGPMIDAALRLRENP